MTGLAYQVERTNVRAVVATLWPVNDAATAILMSDFYRRLRSASAPFVLIGAP